MCSVPAFAATTFKATSTLTAETSNNTSAASSFLTQTNGNVAPGNISKVSTHTLLYPGSTAKVYAHFMPWFGFTDHMNVGYASTDTLQIQKQVNDMVSRGIDGTVIDWYGRGESSAHFAAYDRTTQGIMAQAELHAGFSFAVMADAGALKTCAATAGCDITQTLIDDLNYVNVNYAGSPAYLHFGGRPVIYFFGQDAYTIDWTRVRAGVAGNPLFIFRNNGGFTRTQTNGAFSWIAPSTSLPSTAGIGYLDSYYKTALTFPTMYSTGSGYKGFNDSLAAWGSGRLLIQQCGQTWLQSVADAGKYYSAANQLLGIQLVTWNDYEEATEIETGIDNCVAVSASVTGTVASWTITGQMNTVDHFTVFASQDGENLMWLADVPTTTASLDIGTFHLNSGNYVIYVKAVGKPSLTNKMSAGVQVTVPNVPPTAVLSVTPSSGTAPVTVTASTAGSSDPDGNISSTVISFGDGSAPVNATSATHVYQTAGNYVVTVTVTDNLGASSSKSATMVVSSIAPNKPPVAKVTATPSSAYGPVTVNVSTVGSSDPDGTIASTLINFGDGASASGSTASHTYSTAGVYTVSAKVTDNRGASSTASISVTVKAPEVIVSSPLGGASVNLQPHIVASCFSGNPVSAMQIYVDGVMVYSNKLPSVDTKITVTPGVHSLTVKGWDSAGRSFSKSVSVTAVNQAPTAALSLTSSSILVGASLSASAAGSTDPDGSVQKTTISFGDGTSAAAVSASHQYKAAGTYTVKATITDNLGASSTTSTTVTVKAQSVTILSPTVASTTSTSIRATGTAASGYPVTATQVYLDGVLKFQTPSNTADTTLPISVGVHKLTIQAWDSSGVSFKSSVSVTRN